MPSLTTSLAPQQWHLLIRLALRNAPITDIRAWLWISGARLDDLADLHDRGLVVTGDSPPQVRFSPRGRYITVDRLLPQYRLLSYLGRFREPIRLGRLLTVRPAGRDLLEPLDDTGLIAVTRANDHGQPWPVALAGAATRDLPDLYVAITVTGRHYLNPHNEV